MSGTEATLEQHALFPNVTPCAAAWPMTFARTAITSGLASFALRVLGKSGPCIFMLHRFATEDQIGGRLRANDVEVLLEWIRRRKYRTLDVAELIAEVQEGCDSAGPAIAFTIDDGYHDQAEVGIPLFLRYDCPVTTFLATGFLDRIQWMWHDQIEFLLHTAEPQEVEFELPGAVIRVRLTDRISRSSAAAAIVARCKSDRSIAGRSVAAALAETLHVALPVEAPSAYRPMSWDDARGLEARGARFGAHSVWHPVFSHTSPEETVREIRESRGRLHDEMAKPSPVFCFPFGMPNDFRREDMEACRGSGFASALAASAGYPTAAALARDPLARFRIPRFAFEPNSYRNMQIVNGFERLMHGAQFF